ncbi:MAG: YggS family pyridoxal phosphate-dependent enzyme [Flavobacteriales bacterium]|jgi:PLP dependent protein|nr:YggS family pyridoxal phosphate-dependent enzyme [Flavobacteriales bacterium]MBT7481595.1 YggS family pyridoxal phosphate-dependent enzyme [Flavobacteriales bacterium]
MSISENIQKMKSEIPEGVTLVAVSKTKPISDIEKAYNSGQLIFGENKVQELVEKHNKLPKNIQWHMIGHLQTNKVKFIAPFVSLIHGVDSEKLLIEIDKRGKQNNRIIDCLLQVHITRESAKFGFSSEEIKDIIPKLESYKNVNIIGLMGMATFTKNEIQIKEEFSFLSDIYKKHKQMNTLSMGMSGDYKIAIDCGSTMIRIGSTIFGNRNY